MKTIQTGSKYKIYDDSICTYDRLPAGTYSIGFHQMEGFYLLRQGNIQVQERVYGEHQAKLQKVMDSFRSFQRSLGVILSGDKGIGKSMFAKLVCSHAIGLGYPVILVDSCIEGLSRFIQSIDQECVILFDEFDKMFRYDDDRDEQAALLSLFDGTSGGKKLFIVTCNELYSLNRYLVNRPGRFHYHFRFAYPCAEDIREYLTDKLEEQYRGEIEKVVEFSRKVSLNYDCLRAIAFELNAGNNFSEAIADLNILTTEEETYKVYLRLEGGLTLHNLNYDTNFFDYDGTLTRIPMYNGNGRFVLNVYYDKQAAKYDWSRGAVTVGAEDIRADTDALDGKDSTTAPYAGKKPLCLTFTRKVAGNLHYIV